MNGPYKKDGKWYLDLDQEARDKISHIPGTRISHNHQRLTGSIDGIAVAAVRLGLPRPVEAVSGDVSITCNGLRGYQIGGVKALVHILVEHRGAILADEMGLGKTRQAVALAANMNGRTMIVCPASVRETWKEELLNYGVNDKDIAICGPKTLSRFKPDWNRSNVARFVVSSFDLADQAFKTGFHNDMPNLFILDEGHLVKGRSYGSKKVKRADAIEEIATLSKYRLLISATPCEDRPRDWWRVLQIIFPGRFGNSWQFDHAYCGAFINEHGGLDNRGSSRSEELKLRLSYYTVRRQKREVAAELPPLTRQIRWCEPDDRGRAAFNAAMLGKSETALANALRATLDAKLAVAVELAVEARRFLLVTYLKEHAYELKARIEKEGVLCYAVTGDMPADKRTELIKRAAAEGVGIVATMDSVGTGVDGLQHVASFGIMHALHWMGTKMVQTEARIHRLNSKNPVQWTYLCCQDTMDAVVMGTLVKKLDALWLSMPGSTESPERSLRDSLADAASLSEESEAKALSDIYASME